MGGSSTTTTSVPPPTAQELALQDKQLELSQAQLDAIRQQSAFQGKMWETLGPAFDAQAKLIQQSLAYLPDPNDPVQKARMDRAQRTQDLYAEQELQRAERGGGATDTEIANIKAAADAAIAAGGRDIDRNFDDTLQRIRDEFAPSAGLRATDTPSMYRADLAARETGRLKGDLEAKIRAGEATARLNAPLGTAQTLTAIGQGQASLADAATRFTSDLREAAAANRLQLAGNYGNFVQQAGNFGLGLVQGIGNPTGQGLRQMSEDRYRLASTRTSRGFDFGSLIGPSVGAAASIGAAFI